MNAQADADADADATRGIVGLRHVFFSIAEVHDEAQSISRAQLRLKLASVLADLGPLARGADVDAVDMSAPAPAPTSGSDAAAHAPMLQVSASRPTAETEEQARTSDCTHTPDAEDRSVRTGAELRTAIWDASEAHRRADLANEAASAATARASRLQTDVTRLTNTVLVLQDELAACRSATASLHASVAALSRAPSPAADLDSPAAMLAELARTRAALARAEHANRVLTEALAAARAAADANADTGSGRRDAAAAAAAADARVAAAVASADEAHAAAAAQADAAHAARANERRLAEQSARELAAARAAAARAEAERDAFALELETLHALAGSDAGEHRSTSEAGGSPQADALRAMRVADGRNGGQRLAMARAHAQAAALARALDSVIVDETSTETGAEPTRPADPTDAAIASLDAVEIALPLLRSPLDWAALAARHDELRARLAESVDALRAQRSDARRWSDGLDDVVREALVIKAKVAAASAATAARAGPRSTP